MKITPDSLAEFFTEMDSVFQKACLAQIEAPKAYLDKDLRARMAEQMQVLSSGRIAEAGAREFGLLQNRVRETVAAALGAVPCQHAIWTKPYVDDENADRIRTREKCLGCMAERRGCFAKRLDEEGRAAWGPPGEWRYTVKEKPMNEIVLRVGDIVTHQKHLDTILRGEKRELRVARLDGPDRWLDEAGWAYSTSNTTLLRRPVREGDRVRYHLHNSVEVTDVGAVGIWWAGHNRPWPWCTEHLGALMHEDGTHVDVEGSIEGPPPNREPIKTGTWKCSKGETITLAQPVRVGDKVTHREWGHCSVLRIDPGETTAIMWATATNGVGPHSVLLTRDGGVPGQGDSWTHADGAPIDCAESIRLARAESDLGMFVAFKSVHSGIKLARPVRIGDRLTRCDGAYTYKFQVDELRISCGGLVAEGHGVDGPGARWLRDLDERTTSGRDAWTHEDGAPIDVEETRRMAGRTEATGVRVQNAPVATKVDISIDDGCGTFSGASIAKSFRDFFAEVTGGDVMAHSGASGADVTLLPPIGSDWEVTTLAHCLFETDADVIAYVRGRSDETVLTRRETSLQYEGRPKAAMTTFVTDTSRFDRAMDVCWHSDDKGYRTKWIRHTEAAVAKRRSSVEYRSAVSR